MPCSTSEAFVHSVIGLLVPAPGHHARLGRRLHRYLSCQWIDVTGFPSGTSTLSIVVNPLQTLPESNYDNNVFTVPVRF